VNFFVLAAGILFAMIQPEMGIPSLAGERIIIAHSQDAFSSLSYVMNF
jgi:hypothetical protein